MLPIPQKKPLFRLNLVCISQIKKKKTFFNPHGFVDLTRFLDTALAGLGGPAFPPAGPLWP